MSTQLWDVRDFSREYGDGRAAHDCRSANISGCDKPWHRVRQNAQRGSRGEVAPTSGRAEGRPEGVRAPGRQAVNAFPGADNSDAEPCELQEPCCAGRRDGPLKRVDEVGRKTGPAQHLRPRTRVTGAVGECAGGAAAPERLRPLGISASGVRARGPRPSAGRRPGALDDTGRRVLRADEQAAADVDTTWYAEPAPPQYRMSPG